jgi:hypothetical protein
MAQTGHKSERSFLDYIGKSSMDQISSLLSMVKSKQNQNKTESQDLGKD